jgi:hypothetical protein
MICVSNVIPLNPPLKKGGLTFSLKFKKYAPLFLKEGFVGDSEGLFYSEQVYS